MKGLEQGFFERSLSCCLENGVGAGVLKAE